MPGNSESLVIICSYFIGIVIGSCRVGGMRKFFQVGENLSKSVKCWVRGKEIADQAMLYPSAWSDDYQDFSVLCVMQASFWYAKKYRN